MICAELDKFKDWIRQESFSFPLTSHPQSLKLITAQKLCCKMTKQNENSLSHLFPRAALPQPITHTQATLCLGRAQPPHQLEAQCSLHPRIGNCCQLVLFFDAMGSTSNPDRPRPVPRSLPGTTVAEGHSTPPPLHRSHHPKWSVEATTAQQEGKVYGRGQGIRGSSC